MSPGRNKKGASSKSTPVPAPAKKPLERSFFKGVMLGVILLASLAYISLYIFLTVFFRPKDISEETLSSLAFGHKIAWIILILESVWLVGIEPVRAAGAFISAFVSAGLAAANKTKKP